MRAVRDDLWADALKAIAAHADPDVVIHKAPDPNQAPISAPAIFWALQAGQNDVVQALLASNACITTRLARQDHEPTTHGQTVLDWVRCEADLLSLLKAGLGQFVPCGNTMRDTSLHVAAEFGWVEAVRHIVECSGMIEVRNALGQTPLHALVRHPKRPRDRHKLRQTIEYLVNAGAKTEVRDHEGKTPVQLAAHCFPAMVRSLVRAGADSSTLSIAQQRMANLP